MSMVGYARVSTASQTGEDIFAGSPMLKTADIISCFLCPIATLLLMLIICALSKSHQSASIYVVTAATTGTKRRVFSTVAPDTERLSGTDGMRPKM